MKLSKHSKMAALVVAFVGLLMAGSAEAQNIRKGVLDGRVVGGGQPVPARATAPLVSAIGTNERIVVRQWCAQATFGCAEELCANAVLRIDGGQTAVMILEDNKVSCLEFDPGLPTLPGGEVSCSSSSGLQACWITGVATK